MLRSAVKGKGPIGHDIVGIESAGLPGDKLLVHLEFGGGCRAHVFQLSWDGEVIRTNPPQVLFPSSLHILPGLDAWQGLQILRTLQGDRARARGGRWVAG